MKSKVQCSISRAATTALALAIVLLFALAVTPWAQAQTFTVLYSFKGGLNGAFPNAGLRRDSDGNLYGTTSSDGIQNCYYCGTVFKLGRAGKLTVLYNFTGGADGGNPVAGVVRDPAGNLYGTTYFGGDLSCFQAPNGCGVVFKVSRTGKEKVLISFDGRDGDSPVGGLIRDADGNLYGTTTGGGGGGCKIGCGTVFKLDKGGNRTLLYVFQGKNGDGAFPTGTLLRDSAGTLYGATSVGGNYGYGTIFKLDRSDHETVLHSFTNGADGGYPGGVIRDAANFYGSTAQGGNTPCNGGQGCGIVFKLDKNGGDPVVLHQFTGEDGAAPTGSLVQDSAGNLYGTTFYGGSNKGCQDQQNVGCGVVFKSDTTGFFSVLYRFDGIKHGGRPTGNLILDGDGDLYGTALIGGAKTSACPSGCGLVFELKP